MLSPVIQRLFGLRHLLTSLLCDRCLYASLFTILHLMMIVMMVIDTMVIFVFNASLCTISTARARVGADICARRRNQTLRHIFTTSVVIADPKERVFICTGWLVITRARV